MKKLICALLALIMLLSLAACGKQEEIVQDDSPVTMLITMGNSESYYRALAGLAEEKLGIEVEFVYYISCDSSDMIKLNFMNGDLPADIVFTSAKQDNSILAENCVDLLSVSSVASLFTPVTVQECTTEDGAIYQLPVTSKLIGITYNETLMNEMGWDVPETYADMLDLKAKCEEAGIKFAVSDGAATGHGFNWLFHMMGAQWLSGLDGTSWLKSFQAGNDSVEEFKEACAYFKKWTEDGLWGSFHEADWGGSGEFMKTRALFWYGITNSATGYEGPMYDDEGNETGVMLNDTYRSMPWISEDGTNNNYTYYDSCWVMLNKELEAEDKSDKLQKALSVIELMASEEMTSIVADMAADTYVAVNEFEMGDDRLYANYRDEIKSGFVQPWYYNSFDSDSIVGTGEVINNYIAGRSSFDDIFTALDMYNTNRLNAVTVTLADFPEGLDCENTAKLASLASASAMNTTLEENGLEDRVQVAITPYVPEGSSMQPWISCAACNSKVYPGGLDMSHANTIFGSGATSPCGIYMTGAEIKALVEKGFDPSDRYLDSETGETRFDRDTYGVYPYVCLVKDGAELEDGEMYLVALCDKYLSSADYDSFNEAGRVITDLTNVQKNEFGLRDWLADYSTVTPADLVL